MCKDNFCFISINCLLFSWYNYNYNTVKVTTFNTWDIGTEILPYYIFYIVCTIYIHTGYDRKYDYL